MGQSLVSISWCFWMTLGVGADLGSQMLSLGDFCWSVKFDKVLRRVKNGLLVVLFFGARILAAAVWSVFLFLALGDPCILHV